MSLRLVTRGIRLSALVTGCWVLCGAAISSAEAPHGAEDDIQVVTKQITGKVSALSPAFINIVYQADKDNGIEYEMFLSLDQDVELRSKQHLSEIEVGDTVAVTYDEQQQRAKRQAQDGSVKFDTHIVARKATAIAFLKTAKKGLVSGE